MKCGQAWNCRASLASSRMKPTLPGCAGMSNAGAAVSSVKRSPLRLTRIAPCANRLGDGASAVVTKLMTNGRRTAAGMCSSDHAMKLASAGHGGRSSSGLRFCGATNRSSGPSARSPLTTRAPTATASFWPSPVAVTLTPSISASRGPMKRPLSSGSEVKSPLARITPPRRESRAGPRASRRQARRSAGLPGSARPPCSCSGYRHRCAAPPCSDA